MIAPVNQGKAIRFSKLIAKNFNPIVSTIPLFSDQELLHLVMPVLLIVGEKDGLLDPIKTAERMRKLLSHAYVNQLPDKGYVLID